MFSESHQNHDESHHTEENHVGTKHQNDEFFDATSEPHEDSNPIVHKHKTCDGNSSALQADTGKEEEQPDINLNGGESSPEIGEAASQDLPDTSSNPVEDHAQSDAITESNQTHKNVHEEEAIDISNESAHTQEDSVADACTGSKMESEEKESIQEIDSADGCGEGKDHNMREDIESEQVHDDVGAESELKQHEESKMADNDTEDAPYEDSHHNNDGNACVDNLEHEEEHNSSHEDQFQDVVDSVKPEMEANADEESPDRSCAHKDIKAHMNGQEPEQDNRVFTDAETQTDEIQNKPEPKVVSTDTQTQTDPVKASKDQPSPLAELVTDEVQTSVCLDDLMHLSDIDLKVLKMKKTTSMSADTEAQHLKHDHSKDVRAISPQKKQDTKISKKAEPEQKAKKFEPGVKKTVEKKPGKVDSPLFGKKTEPKLSPKDKPPEQIKSPSLMKKDLSSKSHKFMGMAAAAANPEFEKPLEEICEEEYGIPASRRYLRLVVSLLLKLILVKI